MNLLVHERPEERKRHDELGSAPLPFREGADVPPMQLDQALHEGEAQAEAALAPRQRSLPLNERIEELREELGIDAKHDFLLVEREASVLRRPPDDLAKVDAVPVQEDLPPLDPGDVNEVVDKAGEVLRLTFDHRAGARRLFAPRTRPLQHVHGRANGRERVSELVGEHPEELVLALVALSEPLVRGAQLALQPVAFGDIARDGEDRRDLAARIPLRDEDRGEELFPEGRALELEVHGPAGGSPGRRRCR